MGVRPILVILHVIITDGPHRQGDKFMKSLRQRWENLTAVDFLELKSQLGFPPERPYRGLVYRDPAPAPPPPPAPRARPRAQARPQPRAQPRRRGGGAT